MNEQIETVSNHAPIWFKILGWILLIWNLMGLAVFVTSLALVNNDEAFQNTEFSDAQIELIKSTPTWVNIAFGVAVIFGVLGCIALLLRKSAATPLLVLSLLGVIAQSTYVFLLSNSVELMGVGLSPIVIPVAIALVPFAIYCSKQTWWR